MDAQMLHSIKNTPDEVLVQQYQEVHQDIIFRELYQRYYEKVYRYCLKSLHNTDNASDLAQDIFLRVLEHIAELKNPQLWVAWLFRIAHNRVINFQRKQRHYLTDMTIPALSTEDQNAELNAKIQQEQLLSILPQLLAELPEDQAQILRFKYLEGKTIDTLAEEYHLRKSAVKMRLLRARNHMHEIYEDHYEMAIA